ncbi:uncharacterized protein LOC119111666 [Pollicipes pollicipes]|uniref:uncharacterized protein LOC119111666 n=1 Tax=Pollicipes pollicipes TaxID=41117 RepID=UPI00188566D9|nr:uncharacterized protein LOC119111666 [Pollicipes pollicipes]
MFFFTLEKRKDDRCKSFTFDVNENSCVLYSKVGGYSEFTRLPSEPVYPGVLLHAEQLDDRWTTSNRLNFIYTESGNIPGGGDPVSHLWAGDAIRDSRPGDYHVVVVSAIGPADGVEFAVSRSQSVVMSLGMPVAYETTDGSFSFSGGGTVMYPYLTNTNGILYHMNSIVTSQAGGLIRSRTTTDPRWSQDVQRPGSVRLLLREGD